MNHTLRIIGGKFRGRKLPVLDLEGLRPTPDRIRETLFNWLRADIRHAKCLDAFAGSGALGFEAASRGASQVVFLEQNPIACRQLRKQIPTFITAQTSMPSHLHHETNLQLIQTDALEYLKTTPNQFDIIFLDPPFQKHHLPECLNLIEKTNVLARDGLIYFESNQPIEFNQAVWRTIKSQRTGQIFYGLCEIKQDLLDKHEASCFNQY